MGWGEWRGKERVAWLLGVDVVTVGKKPCMWVERGDGLWNI